MRALVLSSVFPNAVQPTLGVFVQERLRRVAERCDVRVVAPVTWFPLNGLIRGRHLDAIPATESQHGLEVLHPRFFCVPRYLKWLDAATYAASLLPMLRRLRERFAFDLIDAHFAYPDGAAAVMLGKALRVPVMITLRGSIVRLSRYPLHRPQLQWALRGASRIVSVSESLKRVAVGLGIEPSRIRVIPNGVDATRFAPVDRASARRACGLPEDRTILLAVGGIYEGKGHHLVVEALASLVRRHPDLLYVMVGREQAGDRYRGELERVIAARGLTRHVLFAGARLHDELPAWYAAADLFCLATRSEGWANVLLESLACGVPVVTTDVGGNAEIVRGGQDGILVPHGQPEALVRAIDAALQRDWDRSELVRHARGHHWDRVADAVVEEFRCMVPTAPYTASAQVAREMSS
jgi:teichuronic acid biosynthesis glycosyltransferase TuaC